MLGTAADVLLGQRFSVEEDRACIRRLEPADELGQRGFARAVPAHDADHLPFADGEADIFQGRLPLLVAKAQVPHFQQRFRSRGRFRLRIGGEPVPQSRGVGFVQDEAVHMRRVLFRGDVHARIAQSGQVERLPDAVFGQQGGGKQRVRAKVSQNSALIHEDDAVYAPPEDVLQPMLDDEHGGVGLFLDLVDELHGLLAGGRVQVGQRLVEKYDLLPHRERGRRDEPLFLSARQPATLCILVEFQ